MSSQYNLIILLLCVIITLLLIMIFKLYKSYQVVKIKFDDVISNKINPAYDDISRVSTFVQKIADALKVKTSTTK